MILQDVDMAIPLNACLLSEPNNGAEVSSFRFTAAESQLVALTILCYGRINYSDSASY